LTTDNQVLLSAKKLKTTRRKLLSRIIFVSAKSLTAIDPDTKIGVNYFYLNCGLMLNNLFDEFNLFDEILGSAPRKNLIFRAIVSKIRISKILSFRLAKISHLIGA